MPHSPAQTLAILVGIDEYPGAPAWNLTGAVRDACAVAEWLRKCGLPAKNVVMFLSGPNAPDPFEKLNDVDARPADANTVFKFLEEELRNRIQSEDICALVLYWAGHGFVADGVHRLLLSDATPPVPHTLDLTNLFGWLRSDAVPVGLHEQVILVDACTTEIAGRNLPRELPKRTLTISNSKLARNQFQFYASRPGQVAKEYKDKGGLFTTHLLADLNATKAWPPDFNGVGGRLITAFKKFERQGEPQQCPTYFHFAPAGDPGGAYGLEPPDYRDDDAVIETLQLDSASCGSLVDAIEEGWPEAQNLAKRQEFGHLAGVSISGNKIPRLHLTAIVHEGARTATGLLKMVEALRAIGGNVAPLLDKLDKVQKLAIQWEQVLELTDLIGTADFVGDERFIKDAFQRSAPTRLRLSVQGMKDSRLRPVILTLVAILSGETFFLGAFVRELLPRTAEGSPLKARLEQWLAKFPAARAREPGAPTQAADSDVIQMQVQGDFGAVGRYEVNACVFFRESPGIPKFLRLPPPKPGQLPRPGSVESSQLEERVIALVNVGWKELVGRGTPRIELVLPFEWLTHPVDEWRLNPTMANTALGLRCPVVVRPGDRFAPENAYMLAALDTTWGRLQERIAAGQTRSEIAWTPGTAHFSEEFFTRLMLDHSAHAAHSLGADAKERKDRAINVVGAGIPLAVWLRGGSEAGPQAIPECMKTFFPVDEHGSWPLKALDLRRAGSDPYLKACGGFTLLWDNPTQPPPPVNELAG